MTIPFFVDYATQDKALQRALTELGHECVWAKTGGKGLDLALTQKFDAVVLDLMPPEVNGADVSREVRRRGIHTRGGAHGVRLTR